MAFWPLKKRKKQQAAPGSTGDRGILVFFHTSEVIRTEKVLKEAGWPIRVMGPPPEIQSGCDLVIEVPIIEKLNILRVLDQAHLKPLELVPVSGPLLKPVDLFQVKDFGRFLMVRAANMKLTVDKETRTIVNVSGGGCPDVPYLAWELVGRPLNQAPRPPGSGPHFMRLCPGTGLPGNGSPVLLVVGTVPQADFPVIEGNTELTGHQLLVAKREIPVNRGTAALLAAAVKTLNYFNQPSPLACLAGDTGVGAGSRRLYEYLVNALPSRKFEVICFHYLQPDVDWHNRVLFAVQEMNPRPLLIADAGFMYVAKMSGQAEEYDLFTPDAGELAFLADGTAPHPFYTRGFILHEDNKVPDLITRAYEHKNAARYLFVKGTTDYLADSQGILATVAEPCTEALEPIGGTGDTLTGIVAALVATGLDLAAAAILAAKANRLAGSMASPSPATQVAEIIDHIPQALRELDDNI